MNQLICKIGLKMLAIELEHNVIEQNSILGQ